MSKNSFGKGCRVILAPLFLFHEVTELGPKVYHFKFSGEFKPADVGITMIAFGFSNNSAAFLRGIDAGSCTALGSYTVAAR